MVISTQIHEICNFPDLRAPFWGIMLNSPLDRMGVLEHSYLLDDCKSNSYNHTMEKDNHTTKIVQIKFDQLWNRSSFVVRSSSSKGTTETLKVVSTVISSIQLGPTVM